MSCPAKSGKDCDCECPGATEKQRLQAHRSQKYRQTPGARKKRRETRQLRRKRQREQELRDIAAEPGEGPAHDARAARRKVKNESYRRLRDLNMTLGLRVHASKTQRIKAQRSERVARECTAVAPASRRAESQSPTIAHAMVAPLASIGAAINLDGQYAANERAAAVPVSRRAKSPAHVLTSAATLALDAARNHGPLGTDQSAWIRGAKELPSPQARADCISMHTLSPSSPRQPVSRVWTRKANGVWVRRRGSE